MKQTPQNNYFSDNEETLAKKYIKLYKSGNIKEANLVFDKLGDPFYKMILGIINRNHFFTIFGYEVKDLISLGMSFIYITLPKFDKNRTKKIYSFLTYSLTMFFKDLYNRKEREITKEKNDVKIDYLMDENEEDLEKIDRLHVKNSMRINEFFEFLTVNFNEYKNKTKNKEEKKIIEKIVEIINDKERFVIDKKKDYFVVLSELMEFEKIKPSILFKIKKKYKKIRDEFYGNK